MNETLWEAVCKCYERGKGYRKDCWKCHGTGKVKKVDWRKYPRELLAARAKRDILIKLEEERNRKELSREERTE